MKRYKLLKCFPNFEAGRIFTLDEKEAIIYTDTSIGKFKFSVGFIKNFDEWFEEIKSFEIPDEFEMSFWTIMYGEDKFYTWHMPSDEFEDSYEDTLKHHMEIGWAFETKEEAEKHLEWLKARAVLIEDTKGFEPDWTDFNKMKYHVTYDYEDCEFGVWSASVNKYCEIHFATKEDAKNSLETHEKEWKIYFGVE